MLEALVDRLLSFEDHELEFEVEAKSDIPMTRRLLISEKVYFVDSGGGLG